MINPLRGVYIQGNFCHYVPSSYRETVLLKNEVSEKQGGRSVVGLGKSKKTISLTITLDNTYDVMSGDNKVGTTTWSGVSQLTYYETLLGGVGTSLPLTFVAPYGVTYSVVATGVIDNAIFNEDNPQTNGVEFRLTTTLEEV
jgi:hypothetical protein